MNTLTAFGLMGAITMGRNLTKLLTFNMNSLVSSQNTTSVKSTGYDCGNYESIVGILTLTSSVAVSSAGAGTTDMSFYAQQSSVQSTATADSYVTLAGSRVTPTTASDHTLICEVYKPTLQYVRFVLDGTTAVYSNLHVIRGNAGTLPTTARTNQVIELNVSSTSGDA